MEKRTVGTVISSKKQWWLKINTKPFRWGWSDGAVYPYIVQIAYTAEGKEYTRSKWIMPQFPVPAEGSTVQILYDEDHPEKFSIIY